MQRTLAALLLPALLLAAACSDDDDDPDGADARPGGSIYIEATITVIADESIGSNIPDQDQPAETVSTIRAWLQDEEHWRSEIHNDDLGEVGVVSTRRCDRLALVSAEDSQEVPIEEDTPLFSVLVGSSVFIGPTTYPSAEAFIAALGDGLERTPSVEDGGLVLARETTLITVEGVASSQRCYSNPDGTSQCDPIETDGDLRFWLDPETMTILRYESTSSGQSIYAEATLLELGATFDDALFDPTNASSP